MGTVGAAVATCDSLWSTYGPSLGCRGDDGTTRHPGRYRGRAISCGRRTSRGLFARLMVIEAGSGRS
jgi:hypothetical protein